MKTTARVSFLVGCALLLFYGLVGERHVVNSLDGARTNLVTGLAFVQGASDDGFMRVAGQLCDVYSLQPPGMGDKGCKT